MITKEKAAHIARCLEIMATEQGVKSEAAKFDSMAGYHKGVQNAFETAATMLKLFASSVDGAVRNVDALIERGIKCIGGKGDGERNERAYAIEYWEGCVDGRRTAESMLRIADEPDEVDE